MIRPNLAAHDAQEICSRADLARQPFPDSGRHSNIRPASRPYAIRADQPHYSVRSRDTATAVALVGLQGWRQSELLLRLISQARPTRPVRSNADYGRDLSAVVARTSLEAGHRPQYPGESTMLRASVPAARS